jgi:hypothetical protein
MFSGLHAMERLYLPHNRDRKILDRLAGDTGTVSIGDDAVMLH